MLYVWITVYWAILPASLVTLTVAAWYYYTAYNDNSSSGDSFWLPLHQALGKSPCIPDYIPEEPPRLGGRCDCSRTVSALLRSLYVQISRRNVQRADATDVRQLTSQQIHQLLSLPDDVKITDSDLDILQSILDSGQLSLEEISEISQDTVGGSIDNLGEMTAPVPPPPPIRLTTTARTITTTTATTTTTTTTATTATTTVSIADHLTGGGTSLPGFGFNQLNSPLSTMMQLIDTPEIPSLSDASAEKLQGGKEKHKIVPFDNGNINLGVLSSANDVVPAHVPFRPLDNPFPDRPFPEDFVDMAGDWIPGGHYGTQSFLQPVRTLKIRVLLPTFSELFGYQLATQTIFELYVSRVPGPNQRSGIPDIFYERKYWNIMMEVDGNKVLSTVPEDHTVLRSRKTESDNTPIQPMNKADMLSYYSNKHYQAEHPETRTINQSSLSEQDVIGNKLMHKEMLRRALRTMLKQKANSAYMERMTPQQYSKWIQQ